MSDELCHLIEELAANAWPAPVTQVVGGWRLRFAWGVTRRANSVLPNDLHGGPELAERMELVEAFYLYLQVDDFNAGAIRLYQRAGFAAVHSYHYRERAAG